MTPTSDDIKSLSQTLAEYTVWATQKRTLADYIEYKMLKIQIDLNAIEIAQLKGKCDKLHAERAAVQAEAAWLRAQVGQMFPFVEAFVENCYAEWDGHEYECPFCGAGHREFNRDDKFLDAVQEHAEGCTWREAAFWLAAHAPQPEEPQP
jgi:hypothetical protein